MNRRNKHLEQTIKRSIERSPDRDKVYHLLLNEGVDGNSRAMLDILRSDFATPEFVKTHIDVWYSEGRLYGVGTVIYRIKNGWAPNVEKLNMFSGSTSELMQEIEAEEKEINRSLTGAEILEWFAHMRPDNPDFFDQLVTMRGGRIDERKQRELEHERMMSEYGDLIRR